MQTTFIQRMLHCQLPGEAEAILATAKAKANAINMVAKAICQEVT